jgi:hypothetical protein
MPEYEKLLKKAVAVVRGSSHDWQPRSGGKTDYGLRITNYDHGV